MMTTDTLRAAITAALRRRDPNVNLDVTLAVTLLGSRTSTAAVVLYGSDGAVIDVVARACDDAKALRGVAFAVGLREDASDPAEEVERYRTIAGNILARIHRDGGHHADAVGWERAADEADVIVARLYVERDEARAEIERLRAELAETERRLDAEISAMDALDGAYHALNGARDGSDELVALAEWRMVEIKRLRAELTLERERCAGLVREIPACQPGARATAARRWLDDRVAACVRAIEVDDETATCARALVREARERAKAAEADVARLEFALQCEATRHEETRAAARSLIGVLGLYDPAIRDGLLTVQMRYIDDAREALRKIVDGDR